MSNKNNDTQTGRSQKTRALLITIIGVASISAAIAVPLGWVGRKPTETASKIAALEASGQLPKLDTSNSVAGPDTNMNGIRDDIDLYINAKIYPPGQKAAVEQLARAFQKGVTADIANQDSVEAAKVAMGRAVSCMVERFRNPLDQSHSHALIISTHDTLRKFTTNTKNRLLAFLRLDQALDGHIFSSYKNSCE